MEDDQNGNEDDRKGMEEDSCQEARSREPPKMISPSRMVSEMGLHTRPPPPRSVNPPQSDGGQVPDTAGEVYSVSTTGVKTCTGNTRAINGNDNISIEEIVQRGEFDNKKTGRVTVNGVNLMLLQKMKKDSVKMKSVAGRNSPRGRKKKIEDETPSSERISNYFTRMNKDDREGRRPDDKMIVTETSSVEDKEGTRRKTIAKDRKKEAVGKKPREEDLRKTTFEVKKKQPTMKEHIQMFEKLSAEVECVIGSGRCSSHNTKLVRSVVKRKVCNVDADGRITWPMGEAVIFACPLKTDRQSAREQSAIISNTPCFEGTNGNKKLCRRDDMDQSLASQGERILAGRHPIGWDETEQKQTEGTVRRFPTSIDSASV